ncbi:MAG: hypothetical protein PVH61_41890 [Candidatus Aminicenantes bacterium]|jgi:hypothetical protein
MSVNEIKKQKARQYAVDGLLRLDHIQRIFNWSESNARAKLEKFDGPPRKKGYRIEIYLNSVLQVIDELYPKEQ